MPAIACVNGHFSPLESAVVSVEDRGFQLGDGVYEVLRTYNGQPYAIEAHLRRLFRSLAAIELQHRFTSTEFEGLIREGLQRAAFPESLIYLQITRGATKRVKEFPSGLRPTVVLTVRELALPSATAGRSGRIMTAKDIRWQRCDIKSIGLLPNLLTFNRAKAAGFDEAVFVEDDETVAECCSANIFIVAAGQLVTPPTSHRILAGVTREAVIALARKSGLPLAERPVSLAQLRAADEVFLTGTTVEILPVIQLDQQPIGSGQPGPFTLQLCALFRDWVAQG
jgi:D-alanine transaminase